MIGKMKTLVLIFTLAISSFATTFVMTEDQESDTGCKDAPKTMYTVHLAEIEAIYDHEIYLIINSDNEEPICGYVEILPPKSRERECREEWEKREYKEDEEKEERELKEEERKDDEEEREEEEERREEEHEEGEEKREREREDEEEERDEEHEDEREEEHEEDENHDVEREDDEEDYEEECEEGEEREEERKDCCCCCDKDKRHRKKEVRRYHRKRSFRFNFNEGEGRFLLFPSSHRFLGTTALITLQSHGKLKITPVIYVKNTDVVIFPDSKDEEGKYCEIERTRKGVRYGFEDLMGSSEFEYDWDYDDVVLYISRPLKKEYRPKEDVEKERKEER
ncbi:MAG: hypothetical protein JSV09_12210 [Thermoplasmata archaeon]|nr:MAG: hypothetical protein JSV09_12210 [Thermoplasmata archaeon]